VFAHRFDNFTPLEEVCRAFDHVIRQGLAFYWGTSEWEAAQILDAHNICEKYGLVKPIVEQPQYNMLVRDKFEKEFAYLYKRTGLGTTTWSPLFSGVLTGKYINEVPKGSRFDVFSEGAKFHIAQYNGNKASWDDKLKQLTEVAKGLNISLAQLAVTWVIKNPDVSSCILGGSKVEQFEENLKCVEFLDLLTPEVEKKIEDILGNLPTPPLNWRDFTPTAGRRKENLTK